MLTKFSLSCLLALSPVIYAENVKVPLAAPGLTIPNTSVPYALDEYKGRAVLVPIHHSDVSVNHHTGSNIAGSLGGSFFYHPKMTTELDGQQARVQLHSLSPKLYFHVDDGDSDGSSKNSVKISWQIIQLKPEKDHRLVSTIKFNQLTFGAKQVEGVIPTDEERLSGGWVRLTPKSPMSEGEYALIGILSDPKLFQNSVYDFGINPNAAESAEAVTAQ
jgi:hypothetical protein